MMDYSVKWMVGVVVGGLLGGLFFLTCVISSVKAVRDRRRIKARIKAKRAHPASQDNGHAHTPANKRLRPNIRIIHDDEREQRIKKGYSFSSSVASPSVTRFAGQGGLSWPGGDEEEIASVSTDAVIVSVDVSPCHQSCMPHSHEFSSYYLRPAQQEQCGCSCGRTESSLLSDGSYLIDEEQDEVDEFTRTSSVELQVPGASVRYRRASSPNLGSRHIIGNSVHTRSHAKFDRVHVFLDDSNHQQYRGYYRPCNGCAKKTKQRRVSTSDASSSNSQLFPRTGLSSFPGYVKRTDGSSTALSQQPSAAVENNPATLKPRRNSYAANTAPNPTWEAMARVRRHSDESRQFVSSSISRLYQNFMRIRRGPKHDGTDNLAYEAMDDDEVL